MDQFLIKHKLLQITQCEIDNLNSPITNNEMEFIILKPQKNKSSCPDGFTEKFYQTFKEGLTPILHNLFQKMEENTTILIHLMGPAIA